MHQSLYESNQVKEGKKNNNHQVNGLSTTTYTEVYTFSVRNITNLPSKSVRIRIQPPKLGQVHNQTAFELL